MLSAYGGCVRGRARRIHVEGEHFNVRGCIGKSLKFNRSLPNFLLCAVVMLLLHSQHAIAQTTITYEYDELGRLIESSDSVRGDTEYRYDLASNRLSVSTSTPNQSPVANDKHYDAESGVKRTIHVQYVASDPDGDTLIYTYASAGTITNNGGTLVVYPFPDVGDTRYVNYTVADPDGATDNAVITIYTEE